MNDKDNKIFKLTIELATMQGLYIGTLKGILWWDLPEELRSNLEDRIKKLEVEATPTRKALVETVVSKKNV